MCPGTRAWKEVAFSKDIIRTKVTTRARGAGGWRLHASKLAAQFKGEVGPGENGRMALHATGPFDFHFTGDKSGNSRARTTTEFSSNHRGQQPRSAASPGSRHPSAQAGEVQLQALDRTTPFLIFLFTGYRPEAQQFRLDFCLNGISVG